jgi:beta-lactam-binding protein with PASTA domain
MDLSGDLIRSAGIEEIALQPDGKIVAVGGDGSGFILARFLGEPNCLVPTLRGKRKSNAKAALIRYGCSIGRVTRRFSAGVRKGRVVAQDPLPQMVKAQGTPVDFVVSKGKRKRR